MTTTIVPLGTASAFPTRGRHLSATALERKGRVLLFDCGEGTQLQFLEAGLKRSRVDTIFITHLHGDHVYGLMGMLSTQALLNREQLLTVVGPTGIRQMMRAMPGLKEEQMPFPVEYVELAEGMGHEVVMETEEYTVEARPLDHRIFTVGYRFEEKPRPGHLHPEEARSLGVTEYRHFRQLKRGESVEINSGYTVEPEQVVGPDRPGISFAYVTDTRPCAAGRQLAHEADLLLHEATFGAALHERAIETGHSTAREAAEVAQAAEARRLLISHFSARYADPAPLVAEARTVFPNTEAAEELNRYVLDPREKWREGELES